MQACTIGCAARRPAIDIYGAARQEHLGAHVPPLVLAPKQ
jgi:hypothetical protein